MANTTTEVRLPPEDPTGGMNGADKRKVPTRRKADVRYDDGWPWWAKMFMQGGFAAVVVLAFVWQLRDTAKTQAETANQQREAQANTAKQLATMIDAGERRAAEERSVFREEQRDNRKELQFIREEQRLLREQMATAVTAMTRATEALQQSSSAVKTAAEQLPKK